MSGTTEHQIAGRTVLITGAARGIGAGSARRLHAAGANVALVGLEPELLEALAAELGDRAACFSADVTETGQLERAVAGAVERFGGIDVAIANAGIQHVGALATAPPESIERTLAVNLLGVWRTDRAVMRQLIDRRGYLLNIASLAAAAHAPLMGAYAASKAGVEALTNSLRVELAPSGTRVGAAYFGFIDTDLVRGSFAHPSTIAMQPLMPGFISRSASPDAAIDAVERAVRRRAYRVWAPRWVGGVLALRGLLQPISERRMMASPRLAEAVRLADPEVDASGRGDDLLGVSAAARES